MKTFFGRTLIAVLFSLIFLNISASGVSAGDTMPWSVQTVSGDAQYKSGSDWQPLRRDASVKPGHQIRTGPKGSVLLVRDDESVRVAPNSHFEVQPASDSMLTRILQKSGTLLFKVHKRPNKHFEVNTPILAAVVKGTTFTVNVDADGSAVHVIDGLVEVFNADRTNKLLVRPGGTASISSASGSKLRTGVTRKDSNSVPGKQSQRPRIYRTIRGPRVNISRVTDGFLSSPEDPDQTQMARRGPDGEHNASTGATNDNGNSGNGVEGSNSPAGGNSAGGTSNSSSSLNSGGGSANNAGGGKALGRSTDLGFGNAGRSGTWSGAVNSGLVGGGSQGGGLVGGAGSAAQTVVSGISGNAGGKGKGKGKGK